MSQEKTKQNKQQNNNNNKKHTLTNISPDSSKVTLRSPDCAHNQTQMAKEAPISMAWGWFSKPATIYMRPNAALFSSILQETGYTTPRPDCQVSLSFRNDAGPAVYSHRLVDPRLAIPLHGASQPSGRRIRRSDYL